MRSEVHKSTIVVTWAPLHLIDSFALSTIPFGHNATSKQPQQAISPPIPEIIHIPISCQISHEALDHHLIPILHPVILDQTSDQIFMVTDAACLSKAINPMQSHAPCSTVTDERNEDKIQRQEIV